MRHFYILLFALTLTEGKPMEGQRRGEAAFLTPLIEAGKIQEAQKRALVKDLKVNGAPGFERFSFSGYLTVDEEKESHLFFWFFPAIYPHSPLGSKYQVMPLMLWLEGGPGYPSMVDVFTNGPYSLHKNLTIGNRREHAWTSDHSMLYIDSPVGTGYSFTNSKEGYAKSMDDVTRNLHVALIQFFKLFPDYISDDFYVSGTSYAGKYVPALAHRIQYEKEFCGKYGTSTECSPLNLKGVVLLNPYIDPLSQSDFIDAHYQFGMIDKKTLLEEKHWEAKCKTAIAAKDLETYSDCLTQFEGRYREKLGFEYFAYLNVPSYSDDFVDPVKFYQLASTSRALHAKSNIFQANTERVFEELAADMMESSKSHLEAVLSSNLKVLVVSAQLDPVVYLTGVERVVEELDYSQRNNFSAVDRKLWKSEGVLKGYTKQVGTLSLATVLNAGHIVQYDQPKVVVDILTRFMNNIPL